MAKDKKKDKKKKVKKGKGKNGNKLIDQLTKQLKKAVKAHGPEIALSLTASIVGAIVKRKELNTQRASVAQSVKETIASIGKQAKEVKDTVVEGAQDLVSSDDEKEQAPKKGRSKKAAAEPVGGPSDEDAAMAI